MDLRISVAVDSYSSLSGRDVAVACRGFLQLGLRNSLERVALVLLNLEVGIHCVGVVVIAVSHCSMVHTHVQNNI